MTLTVFAAFEGVPVERGDGWSPQLPQRCGSVAPCGAARPRSVQMV